MCGQEPPGQSRADRVLAGAQHVLRHLDEQVVGEAIDRVVPGAARCRRLQKLGNRDVGGVAGAPADDGLAAVARTEVAGDADQALRADGADFDPDTVLGFGQHRIHRVEGEMDVAQRRSGPLGDVADGAVVDLDVRHQSIEAVLIERCEHRVAVQFAHPNLHPHSSKLLLHVPAFVANNSGHAFVAMSES
ncbi:hypothetical protein EB75_10160 [Mycobacterium sp. ST-F2]|nr:hypothetical protein EB75_10160 [Mycobacterium sp. ST-F2]